MKLKIKIISILLPAVASFSVSAQQLSLSREQCIEIALRDNPVVRIADMEVKK